MKKLFPLLFLLFCTPWANAQDKPVVTLVDILTVDDNIEVTLATNQNFIVGNNRYILHIGTTHYLHSKHPDGDISKIAFILTEEQFASATDGAAIKLVYGLYEPNTKLDASSEDFQGLNYSVGTLDKSMLDQ